MITILSILFLTSLLLFFFSYCSSCYQSCYSNHRYHYLISHISLSLSLSHTHTDGAKNNKLMSVPLSSVFPSVPSLSLTLSSSLWKDLNPYNEKILIESILPFKDFSVITGREDGLSRVWLLLPNVRTYIIFQFLFPLLIFTFEYF